VKHLAEMPNLRKIQIQDNPQLGDEGFRHLTKLKSLEHLECSISLTEESFSHIAEMTSLQILTLPWRPAGTDFCFLRIPQISPPSWIGNTA
tara:strand:+ start:12084 stop:12356 length:273 start_codon:yes stop_codon:yes gene_type:complete